MDCLAGESSLMAGDMASWRLMMFGALLGIFVPYGYQSFRQKYFDAKQYYTYQSTEGPFEGVMTNGEMTVGKPISAAKPGEWIAWRTAICFSAGVSVAADAALRALSDDKPIKVRHTIIPADAQCGPQVEGFQLPDDISEGDYAIDRLLRIEPLDAPPVSTTVPSIAFHVTR